MNPDSNYIQVSDNIRLVPVVDAEIDERRLSLYPQIGHMIALAGITKIVKLRELCLDLFPQIREGEINCVLGGFSLVENGSNVLVRPHCCGDFSNVGEWDVLSDFKNPGWSKLSPKDDWIRIWFGHPELAARQDRHSVLLATDDGSNRSPAHPLQGLPILRVPVRALRQAYDEATDVMETIELRLY